MAISPEARRLLLARALRGVVDGYVAVLLPAYLIALGLDIWQVGLLSTTTLLGSAFATLAVGAWGHHAHSRTLLLGASALMAAARRSARACSPAAGSPRPCSPAAA